MINPEEEMHSHLQVSCSSNARSKSRSARPASQRPLAVITTAVTMGKNAARRSASSLRPARSNRRRAFASTRPAERERAAHADPVREDKYRAESHHAPRSRVAPRSTTTAVGVGTKPPANPSVNNFFRES